MQRLVRGSLATLCAASSSTQKALVNGKQTLGQMYLSAGANQIDLSRLNVCDFFVEVQPQVIYVNVRNSNTVKIRTLAVCHAHTPCSYHFSITSLFWIRFEELPRFAKLLLLFLFLMLLSGPSLVCLG